MMRRPPRSTRVRSSAASDVYKRQVLAPFVGLQSDAWCHRETLDAPRYPCAAWWRQRSSLANGATQLALYHAAEFAVMFRHGRRDDLKSVKRVTVVGGMHTGVENAENCLVKIA